MDDSLEPIEEYDNESSSYRQKQETDSELKNGPNSDRAELDNSRTLDDDNSDELRSDKSFEPNNHIDNKEKNDSPHEDDESQEATIVDSSDG